MRSLLRRRSRPGRRSISTAVVAFLAVLGLLAAACSSEGDDTATPTGDQTPATSAQAPAPSDDAPVDPLPDVDAPGLATCEGCPTTDDFTDFRPDFGTSSSHKFQGTISLAKGNGRFYVEGTDGQAFGGPIETDPQTGKYSVTVPLVCGEHLLKLVWENDKGAAGAVLRPRTTGCAASDIRVTLSWDDKGDDFELHLIREGGTINDGTNDCTWTSCIGVPLDWGRAGDRSDDPVKDVDDVDTLGPENIVYPQPAAGRYTVMVEHWGSGQPGANGTVVLNVTGQRPVEIPITGLDPQHVFIAATIDWPAGTITVVATRHDCTANWSSGCLDKIPA